MKWLKRILIALPVLALVVYFGLPKGLQAMGLPVRVAKLARGGKPLQVVMAGPFASDGQAGAALTAARKAGFRDAFLRK